LQEYATELGLDLVGVTTPEPFERYLSELDERREHYAHRYASRLETWRGLAQPREVMKKARAVVVIGYCYYGDEADGGPNDGRFARIVSYGHLGILQRARLVRGFLGRHGHDVVLGAHRKEAAVRAGLGAVGKNGLVLNQRVGGWVAYQSLVTDAPLPPDEPFAADLCGKCDDCLRACPTGALYEPRRVDPRRCITSLLTSVDVPEDVWPHFGNRILGCDACLDACPRNRLRDARSPPESLFPDGIGLNVSLRRLLRLDEKAFQREFLRPVQSKLVRSRAVDRLSRIPGVQPLLRVLMKTVLRGREVLPETFIHASGNLKVYQRNALIAAGNLEATALRSDVEACGTDATLRRASDWALARMSGAGEGSS
jgi:epoxyqueuosine reductase